MASYHLHNMEQDFIYRTYDTIPYAATVYKWDKEKQQQRFFLCYFHRGHICRGAFFFHEDLCKWAVALDNNSILKPELKTECGLPAET